METERREFALGYCILPEAAREDPVFDVCYRAAIEYAENADVPEPREPSALYDLLIAMLASTWYDARGTITIGQTPHKLERTASALILSLR